jgi:hypothetical protein
MTRNFGKFLSVFILIVMLAGNVLACKRHKRTRYSNGYAPVSRRYNGEYYRTRRNHSTRNAILQVAVPAAAGLGVGALIGGSRGAGIGAIAGGGSGLVYHLATRRR